MKKQFVITISRQLGSGGRHIGQQLAKSLGILFADREIISQAASALRIREKEVESREERALFWRSLIESYAMNTDDYLPTQLVIPIDRELYDAETNIIERIAAERSAIFIGRCSNFILMDHPHHVSVYVHASDTFRIARIKHLYKVTDEEATKMMIRSDKERGRYNKKYTGIVWTDLRQYDICLDTSKLGLEKSYQLLLTYLADRGINPQ